LHTPFEPSGDRRVGFVLSHFPINLRDVLSAERIQTLQLRPFKDKVRFAALLLSSVSELVNKLFNAHAWRNLNKPA